MNAAARPVRLARAPIRWLRSDKPGTALALAPFFAFCVLFELIPVVILVIGALGGIANPTPQYLLKVFQHPIYRQSVINSLVLSTISGLVGAVIGTAVGYIITTTRHERVRHAATALANVSSASGGVGLAFAFIVLLGASGAITTLFAIAGVNLYQFFSIYSLAGLVIVYCYFQIPLMVVLMLPAFTAIKPEWREASMSMGGTSRDFWRRVGIPVLTPAIVASFILMFASGMGAYATAVALVAQANLMTVQVSILRSGEVIFKPAQADAMATILLCFVASAVVLYHMVRRRTQRWTA
jgi:putative spermidine/putrescine transport system permease protein